MRWPSLRADRFSELLASEHFAMIVRVEIRMGHRR